MSANIQTYIGRQAAWHRLGVVIGTHFNFADAEREAGLDFGVFKSQLRDGLGRPVDAWGTFRWNAADRRAGDKEAAIFLGTVGEAYKIIPHAEGFKLIDSLVATADGAHYETAGVLGKGEVVWGLADLNLTTRVGDDVQKNYVLFSTGHDGSYSWNLRAVNERVVCNNTLDIALSERTKASFRVRHTKNARLRIDEAHVALQNLTGDIKAVEQKLQYLAGKKITREGLNTIFDRLFPQTEKDGDGGKVLVSSKQRDAKLAEVLTVYEDNDGNAFPEQRGSAYNLLNAVTQYTDHVQGGGLKAATRAESAIFGGGSKLKTAALDAILDVAAGLPNMTRVDFFASNPGSLLDAVVENSVV